MFHQLKLTIICGYCQLTYHKTYSIINYKYIKNYKSVSHMGSLLGRHKYQIGIV